MPKLALSFFVLSALGAGCGGGDGVGDGATVTAYVSALLCEEAEQVLARGGGEAGDLRVQAVCVDDTGTGDARLAAIGAAARRATEDSAAIAYIGTPDPTAIRFSEPILEEADIPRISTASGTEAMNDLLRALREADDSGSLRESIGDELQ